MEPRVETAYLLDFYGALLTPRRREMLRMRYEEDMSLSEIGAQMGISRQAVSKWETGDSAPDLYNLISLSDVLDAVSYTHLTLPTSDLV